MFDVSIWIWLAVLASKCSTMPSKSNHLVRNVYKCLCVWLSFGWKAKHLSFEHNYLYAHACRFCVQNARLAHTVSLFIFIFKPEGFEINNKRGSHTQNLPFCCCCVCFVNCTINFLSLSHFSRAFKMWRRCFLFCHVKMHVIYSESNIK